MELLVTRVSERVSESAWADEVLSRAAGAEKDGDASNRMRESVWDLALVKENAQDQVSIIALPLALQIPFEWGTLWFCESHADQWCTMLATPWCYGFTVRKSLTDTSGDEVDLGVLGQIVGPRPSDIAAWVGHVRSALEHGHCLDGGWSPARSVCVLWDDRVRVSYYKTEYVVGAFDVAVLCKGMQQVPLHFVDTFTKYMLCMHGAMQEYMFGLEALFNEVDAVQKVQLLDHVRYESESYRACCEASLDWWIAFWDM